MPRVKKIFLVKESSNMALLFGILAIITGLFLPILFGWIGFAIPTVLGVLAIVFAILKNKKLAEDGQRKRVAGFVCAGIGILIAALMIAGMNVASKKLKAKMEEYGVSHFPILEKSVDKLGSGGIVGVIVYAKNEVDANMDKLKDEFDLLKQYMDGALSSDTPSSEASSEASTAAAGGEGAEGGEAVEGGEGGEAVEGGEGAEGGEAVEGGEGAEGAEGEEGVEPAQ